MLPAASATGLPLSCTPSYRLFHSRLPSRVANDTSHVWRLTDAPPPKDRVTITLPGRPSIRMGLPQLSVWPPSAARSPTAESTSACQAIDPSRALRARRLVV